MEDKVNKKQLIKDLKSLEKKELVLLQKFISSRIEFLNDLENFFKDK